MVISSLDNDRVKYYTKLSHKKYRDIDGVYIVEGEHLVQEAIKASVVREVILLDGYTFDCLQDKVYVSYDVMAKISNMDTPPSVMALCYKSNSSEIIGRRIVMLEGIQDPGNLGTIIRSCVAFGIDTIILTEGSVDLYNPKVLRATQGMHFHINIVTCSLAYAVNFMKKCDIPIYGTSVVDGVDAYLLNDSDRESFCLIMGNEGNGLSDEAFGVCDKNLYIKMSDKVESLNVGVACSILLYELGR